MSAADDALDRLEYNAHKLNPAILRERYDDLATVRDRLASQEQELERLRDERDSARSANRELAAERDAAEAEVRRLTEGLRDVETCAGYPVMVREKARALLAGSPSETVSATPRADSPDGAKPEGGEA